MNVEERCELAKQILRATNDGENLAPGHLKLLELAVNGFLNEEGEKLFRQLAATAAASQYVKPFLHGVEHMTHDHEGYVYYKGIHVEHFSFPWVYSPEGKKALLDLKEWCERQETTGLPITAATAMSRDFKADGLVAQRKE